MENKDNKRNMYIGIYVGIIVIICLFVFINNKPTKKNKSNISSDYETSTSDYCSKAGCTNKRASGSIYCYTHKSSSSSSYSSSKKCSAYPCPNDAVAGSSYCSIHKKGKTKKCAKCGKAIWDDETFCDSCLYSSVINSKSKY